MFYPFKVPVEKKETDRGNMYISLYFILCANIYSLKNT